MADGVLERRICRETTPHDAWTRAPGYLLKWSLAFISRDPLLWSVW